MPIYGNSGVGEPGTDGHNMVVIDLASRKVVGNVDWGKGVRPHDPVFGPEERFAVRHHGAESFDQHY